MLYLYLNKEEFLLLNMYKKFDKLLLFLVLNLDIFHNIIQIFLLSIFLSHQISFWNFQLNIKKKLNYYK